jgi:hypothetical protein
MSQGVRSIVLRPFLLLVFSVSLCLCGETEAPAAEAKEQYRLRIVLDFAPQRALTDYFRRQVAGEVGDGLRAALGELAAVEVVDADRPPDDLRAVVAEVRRDGLERALNGWKRRGPVLDHFVRVEQADGQYRLQGLAHDGLTGLPGPVVRTRATRYRADVGRTAALLVERDLALSGLVRTNPDRGGTVQVELRGGGLGAATDRWVRKGDLFGLVEVPSPTAAGRWVPWSFLEVQGPPAADGSCSCKLITRYANLKRLVGLRCVRLGTITGPLRLRLVRDQPTDPGLAVTLEFRSGEFKGDPLATVPADETRDVETGAHKFSRLAYVTVRGGEGVRAQVPVPILDDRLVVVPVPARSGADNRLRYTVNACLHDIAESYLDQAALFKSINELSRQKERARAVERARAALARASADYRRLSTELDDLQGKKGLAKEERARLARARQGLEQLKAGEGELREHLADLEKIEKEENDPARREYLEQVKQAQFLEKKAEVEKAVALYEKLTASPHATAELKKYAAALKASWEPKSDEHRQARAFVYHVWPNLDTPGLDARLKEATKHLEVLRKVGDRYGLRKFRDGTLAQVARLTEELRLLKPHINRDDGPRYKLVQKIVEPLRKLDDAIVQALEAKK